MLNGTINREEVLARAGHVAVLMGGASPEREISLKSGRAVAAALRRLGAKVSAVDVAGGAGDLLRLVGMKPDLAFNVLHGRGGEDGAMQGLLETAGIPYTGSGVLASALAMDKEKSKLIWQRLGLGTARFAMLDEATDWGSVIDRLGAVAVKPVSGGSSLGVAIAESADELRRGFAAAREFDPRVMAERYVKGREFSVGVLGGELLPVIEIRTGRRFLDYEAKYNDPGTRIICPPEIDAAERARLEALARRAYDSLGCRGLARVDFVRGGEEGPCLLEVNTLPGLTAHSFVPAAAASAGMDYDALMLAILDRELAAG